MGKFQSKLAPKRRQSPEGGSLTSNVLNCQREKEQIHTHKTKLTENLFVELRENNPKCSCKNKVFLPAKTTIEKGLHLQVDKQTKKRSSHVCVSECSVSLDENAKQEWLFTLYNLDSSGSVNKEDMCSLIHSMYDVLDASIKHPADSTFPLKIKLVVTPAAEPEKTLQISKKSAEMEVSASPEGRVRGLYCADENMERRNHYLDLAGIENYSSKFDDTESPSQEQRPLCHAALQHHPVAVRENCTASNNPSGLYRSYSLKGRAVSMGKERNTAEGKRCRCQLPLQSHPQRTHSKRLRSRAQDAAPHLQPGLNSSSRRHEHHHQHEHHHHHHHHYHPPLMHLNT